ncbi:uncharacterized protein BX663DRAFT_507931 [Cokeromyces recurvatus]|uniref:uncharacterized protein n=1 Tax=Cokeromyces recurvatus TaxID=90255 RepID=UPI002220FE66|nr:uncharacterized protein BX663DRAFT_507931 [Cokeromyces recurvatus]KAI7903229.1 hypothetical protein BX663DRAFT_507931 [Cokeromyces recurvatus]
MVDLPIVKKAKTSIWIGLEARGLHHHYHKKISLMMATGLNISFHPPPPPILN